MVRNEKSFHKLKQNKCRISIPIQFPSSLTKPTNKRDKENLHNRYLNSSEHVERRIVGHMNPKEKNVGNWFLESKKFSKSQLVQISHHATRMGVGRRDVP